MRDKIKQILVNYPATRNGTQQLLAKYAEINGSTREVIEWLYNTPIETIARIRRELIQEDKDQGWNVIQPSNKKALKDKEFTFYHHYTPLRKKPRQEYLDL